MRTKDELIDEAGSGWRLVQEWIGKATNSVEIIPTTGAEGGECLTSLQVTTRSPMGAVAYHTGGLRIDHGWVRVLGAPSERSPRSIAGWNRLGQPNERLSGALLVGDDVLGGFFAINGGRFEGNPGMVHYYAPDTLAWESTDLGYSDWLIWLFRGDLERYYATCRWAGWRTEMGSIGGDKGILVYPFPCADGPDFELRNRSLVPIDELWSLYVEQLPLQLGG